MDVRSAPQRRRLCRRAVTAILVLWVLGPPAPAAERGTRLPEIVARAIEHHGGELYRRSETSLRLCSRSGCYEIRSRVDGGLFDHRVSGPYRGGRRTVRATNESVSLQRDGVPEAVLPETRQGLRDWVMARVYFAFLPFRLDDPDVRYRDHGVERWEERLLHKVEVGFAAGSSTDAGDRYLYWFDPESARLEQFAYSFAGDPGGLRFRRLDNYRRVGGILFFDQTNLGVEGEGLDVDRITPEFVRLRLRPISEVTLREVRVRPLAAERADAG